jgi:cell division initiation protein
VITLEEIQNKAFTKVVRGYKEDEVDTFLDRITVEFDRMRKENATLKEAVRLLEADVERYKSSEGTVIETLESVKELMSDISASAEKRAEILLKNAELDAERIRREARDSLERMSDESEEMTKRLNQFKTRFRNLLQNELDRFEMLDFFTEDEPERSDIVVSTLKQQKSHTIKTVKNKL